MDRQKQQLKRNKYTFVTTLLISDNNYYKLLLRHFISTLKLDKKTSLLPKHIFSCFTYLYFYLKSLHLTFITKIIMLFDGNHAKRKVVSYNSPPCVLLVFCRYYMRIYIQLSFLAVELLAGHSQLLQCRNLFFVFIHAVGWSG